VKQTDPNGADSDEFAVREELLRPDVAHIAMHRMDFSCAEGRKDGDVSEVSGVEDNGALRKDGLNLPAEGICAIAQMGI
jgi:hypothetical protein